MTFTKLSIVIPVFNEENYVSSILDKVLAAELPTNISKEIVVVDDGSTDGTALQLKEYSERYSEITVITKEKNSGKGSAIQQALSMVRGQYVLIQDADLEYDPKDYHLLLQPIVDSVADVVYGSRFVGNQPHRVLFFWHSIANRFLTFLSNLFTNLNLTDIETGYKVFPTSIIKELNLRERRFGFEPEVTAKFAKIPNIRIYEVGISYYGRTYQQGKKIRWPDGIRALYCIFRYNLFR